MNQINQNQIQTSNSVTDGFYSISVSLSIMLIRERVIEASKACEDIFVDSRDDKTREKDVEEIVNQISDCNGIFIRMEHPLLTLKTDQGSSSSEIFSLYQEEVDMNLKLSNRQDVRRELCQSEDLVVIKQHIPTIIFARIKNLIPTFQIGLQVVAVGDDSKNTRQDMAVASEIWLSEL